MRVPVHFAIVTLILVFASVAHAADYPREGVIDTSAGPDEAAVNVQLANNRWPDCTTLESAIGSIWRIEGVTDKSGQERALALWKWFRIMVSGTGGGYAYEGAKCNDMVWDPHKILTVYGHHQCDGQSWAMVGMWRAAGLMAFDECHHGHTIAALRYQDDDGVWRYHSLDPQGRFFYWDDTHNRIGTWRMPVMTGTVYRHITAPQQVHSLRTGLRFGETVERNWQNTGHVVPNGMTRGTGELKNPKMSKYYEYREGRTDGTYAANGEEVQTLVVNTTPADFGRQFYTGSRNVDATLVGGHRTRLHPAKAGEPAVAVYRLPPPYVATDATVSATLTTSADGDVCRVSMSRDGGPWEVLFDKQKAGAEQVAIDLGRQARSAGKPSVYGAYDVLLRVEMQTAGRREGVGVDALQATVYRMLNKRTLPNLMPGENMFRLTFDKLAEEQAIQVQVDYELKGETRMQSYVAIDSPFYFKVDAPGVELRKISNYDQDFNREDVRMVGYSLRVVPAPASPSASLPAPDGEAAFKLACPHPADQTSEAFRKKVKVPETDPMQTNGFFPQSRERREADAKMAELIAKLKASVAADGGSSVAGWLAAQELGCYPAALDELLAVLPKANIDMTLYLCKAISQIGDRKAVPALVAKWARHAPGGAPGGRYIPDALVACGAGPDVVPALVKPLKRCRFDLRFHVAHALGRLGGEQAAATLQELADNDPFPAVRDQAKRSLAMLQAGK